MYIISAGLPNCGVLCIVLAVLAGFFFGTSVVLMIVLVIKKVSFFVFVNRKYYRILFV